MAAADSCKYNGRMGKTIRAFIAIDLPQEVKEYLGQLTHDLAKQAPGHAVRWVKPERMHLTFRFLGETEETLIPNLGRALDEVVAQQRPFMLFLDGFGCFPNCKRPRVLWAGIGGDMGAAEQLKKAIDQALIPFGWQAETRPFRPHLTVGRVKDAGKAASTPWPGEVQKLAVPGTAIHLIESDLTPEGPRYTMRHSSSFLDG